MSRGEIIGGIGSWKNGMFDRPSATWEEVQADKKRWIREDEIKYSN
jgi:hypothetical protein